MDGIIRAYQGSPGDSPIRRLLVDLWARNPTKEWLGADMPSEFSLDLIRELLLLRQDYLPSHPSDGVQDGCIYHQHSEQRLCYGHASNEPRSRPA